MDKVSIGIIGAGNMGKNHIRIVRELSNIYQLRAVYDPDIERLDMLGMKPFAAASEDEALDKCDAVIVAAPSSLHKDIALKAAKKRKHLLVEKPLALSQEDAEQVLKAYEGIDRVLMVGHVERFNSAVIELAKILRQQEIVAVHIERCSSFDRRIQDTDVIYDLMIHDIDILLNGILPLSKWQYIAATGKKVFSEKFLDYAECIMQFDNGVVSSVISSRITEEKIRKIEVHCKNAYIEADLLNKKISVSRKTILNEMNLFSSIYKQENIVEKVFVPNIEPLKAELQHFYECIQNGHQPLTNGKSAICCIQTLDMIKDSIIC